MKTNSLHYPNPIEAVQEFGQFKARKFAELLGHKTEQLSKKAKYLALIAFLISSLNVSVYLLVIKSSSFSSLPDQIPTSNLPYFPKAGNRNTTTDSLFLSNAKTSNQQKS